MRRLTAPELWLKRLKSQAKRWQDVATGYPRIRRNYRRRTGQDPNLKAPRSFSEKVIWRKINDRNPLFPILSDKLRVRDYIEERLGADRAGALLPEVVWQSRRASDLPRDLFDRGGVVVKSNHGSGRSVVLPEGHDLDYETTVTKFHNWLGTHSALEAHEWVYLPIPRRVFAERLHFKANGAPVDDFKLFMIHGKPYFFQVMSGVSSANKPHDLDWQPMDFCMALSSSDGTEPMDPIPRPPNLAELIDVAETLADGLDMVRIDFLAAEDRYWLGEMTLLPTSGNTVFHPPDYGLWLGDQWTLPDPRNGKRA